MYIHVVWVMNCPHHAWIRWCVYYFLGIVLFVLWWRVKGHWLEYSIQTWYRLVKILLLEEYIYQILLLCLAVAYIDMSTNLMVNYFGIILASECLWQLSSDQTACTAVHLNSSTEITSNHKVQPQIFIPPLFNHTRIYSLDSYLGSLRRTPVHSQVCEFGFWLAPTLLERCLTG